MWRARLSPQQPAGALVAPGRRVRASGSTSWRSAIRDVIDEAIAAGGSSLRDHIRTDGTLGYFQHGFSRLRPRGRDLPATRLRRYGPPHRAERALDLLLPALPDS